MNHSVTVKCLLERTENDVDLLMRGQDQKIVILAHFGSFWLILECNATIFMMYFG